MRPLVGLLLAPDLEWLGLVETLLSDVELFSVTPETLWKPRGTELRPNSFHRLFSQLPGPFVAHSVAMSPGSPTSARRDRWLNAMRRDHAVFDFQWWTDHHGVTEIDGRNHALPRAAALDVEPVRGCLAAMSEVVPLVGLEVSWFAQMVGSPPEEAAFLRACTQDHAVLLDLHNLWAMSLNLGFSVEDYLEVLGLDRVIEIHVSGGRANAAGLRLDSHDTAVPEPVFELLEQVAPRCPSLRAITLERFEGTVTPQDVPVIRDELARIREVCATGEVRAQLPSAGSSRRLGGRDALNFPFGEVRPQLPEPNRLEQALIAKLRFERLVQGSPDAAAWFERDTPSFVRAFRAYDAQVPPTAFFANEEAQLWEAWRG